MLIECKGDKRRFAERSHSTKVYSLAHIEAKFSVKGFSEVLSR